MLRNNNTALRDYFESKQRHEIQFSGKDNVVRRTTTLSFNQELSFRRRKSSERLHVMAEQSKKSICLFNSDGTYKLEIVETLLMQMNKKHGFNFAIEKCNFRLQQIADICETTIPQLQMDYAIFVVHANESRLSINEDNAGIGYARVYRALLQATSE